MAFFDQEFGVSLVGIEGSLENGLLIGQIFFCPPLAVPDFFSLPVVRKPTSILYLLRSDFFHG
jgi:hypothetical protein